jgi:hypothetical protein
MLKRPNLFWILWLATTILSWAFAIPIGHILHFIAGLFLLPIVFIERLLKTGDTLSIFLGSFLYGPIVGVMVGSATWAAASYVLPSWKRWLLATIIGLGVGFACCDFFGVPLITPWTDAPAALPLFPSNLETTYVFGGLTQGIIIGIALGITQTWAWWG